MAVEKSSKFLSRNFKSAKAFLKVFSRDFE